MTFGYYDEAPKPLTGAKADALRPLLSLLVAHDNFLTVNDQWLTGIDYDSRKKANTAMVKVISDLLSGNPVDNSMSATLHPRLDNLAKWARENPTAVPNAEFADNIASATAHAGAVSAFVTETSKEASIGR